jgi:hypothetical protein
MAHRHPNEMPAEVADRLVELRKQRPTWGPAKLRAFLQTDEPSTKWPAASTIGDLLERRGMVAPRKKRLHRGGDARPGRAAAALRRVPADRQPGPARRQGASADERRGAR